MLTKLIEDATIHGWIFDLDGVLTDTAELHYRAWKELADGLGIPFDRTRNEALRGVSRRESLLIVLDGRSVPEDEIQGLLTKKNNRYVELLGTLTRDNILDGAEPFVMYLKHAGKKVGVASASRNTERILSTLGITDWFDGVSSGNSVTRSKPAPDVFVHCAGLLRLPVGSCVVVEDAAAGITGANDGGFCSLGIGPEDRVGNATYRIDSTAELDPATWNIADG